MSSFNCDILIRLQEMSKSLRNFLSLMLLKSSSSFSFSSWFFLNPWENIFTCDQWVETSHTDWHFCAHLISGWRWGQLRRRIFAENFAHWTKRQLSGHNIYGTWCNVVVIEVMSWPRWAGFGSSYHMDPMNQLVFMTICLLLTYQETNYWRK